MIDRDHELSVRKQTEAVGIARHSGVRDVSLDLLFAIPGQGLATFENDLREAVALGDRIAVLEGGRIAQEGTLEALRARPATRLVRALLDDLEGTR